MRRAQNRAAGIGSDRGRKRFAALLTGAALMASTPALAQTADMPAANGRDAHHACDAGGKGMRGHGARIIVTGEGEAATQPDMATINLGVTTQAETAAAAMQANSAQQTSVIDALTAAGIEARDIQTSGLNLNPMMDYSSEGQPPRVTGYQAQNMVTVRVRDLDGLGVTLDAIVGAGANEINGITFGRDDSDQVQDDARRDAVADARHRAEVMAEAAGLTLGPVLTIRDAVLPSGGPQPMMMRQAMVASDGGAVPVQGGELTMTAQVEVQFALIGAGGMGDCGAMAPDADAAPDAATDEPAGDDAGTAPSN
ncbi:SIMPL domain-containing protein [Paracoccus sp. M683]|uniref:SIMPL domain-containing protein n=1 Tax=Paracoccus sp. M683 TaxID=2594268 RepID=UPI00117E7BA8|nr:SIMPL domain-containing protein [Paracoccus sp. M683]TRW98333.1 SIMPL domain-containing protein [Paracoccus sp. M683]